MSVCTRRSFSIARRLLSLIGLWIEQEGEPVTIIQWISHWFCLFACILLIAASAFDVSFRDHHFKRKTQFLLLLCQQLAIVQLFFVLKTKKSKLLVLINQTFQDIQVPSLMVRQYNMFAESCQKSARALLKAFFFGLLQFIVLWMYNSIKHASHQIQASTKNENDSVLQMAIALNIIPTTILSTGFLFLYSTLSALTICMIKHLDAIFLYLHKTEQLPFYGEPSFNIIIKEILKYAHRIHLRIIDLVNGINACFANLMLMQLLVVLLAQCILAFHFVSPSDENSGFSEHENELKLALAQSILLLMAVFGAVAYLASKIMHLSFKLQNTCSETAWWAWNKENQRIMKVMNARLGVPLQLKLGPFYVLSLSFFATMLQISFSYLIILISISRGSSKSRPWNP